jgi:hypothetical protein
MTLPPAARTKFRTIPFAVLRAAPLAATRRAMSEVRLTSKEIRSREGANSRTPTGTPMLTGRYSQCHIESHEESHLESQWSIAMRGVRQQMGFSVPEHPQT